MANILKIKAGSGVPTTSDIVDREIAFNRSDNKLYINDSGTIVNLSGAQGGGSADEADRIVFDAQAGEALSKGDVVYISGISGNTPIVSKADADDANKMPSFGLAAESASLNNSVQIVTFGTLENFDTSAFSVGDTVFVSTTAGGLTATAPSGESGLIQNMGHIVRSHASTGAIKLVGAGRSAATPNLNQDKIFLGNASNQAVSTALSSIGLSKFNNDLGFGGGANRLITDDGDGTVTTESGLTYNGSTLAVTGDQTISGVLKHSSNGDNRLTLDDDSDLAQINQVTLASVNNVNILIDGTNNGTGDFQIRSSPTTANDLDTADIIVDIDETTAIFDNITSQQFKIGGASRTTINESGLKVESGSLGVGQTPPSVNGSAHISNLLRVGTNGEVALTVNDGGGNANVTFNHTSKVPDRDGNSGRIEVNVDSSGGQYMAFELAGNVTSGVSVDTDEKFRIDSAGADVTGELKISQTDALAPIYLRDSRASYNAEISQKSDGRISLATRAGTYGSNGSIEILDSGNVGIGTTSPSYLLHLSGTAPELAFTDTDGTKTWRARAVTNNFHITETGGGDLFVIESGAGGNALRVRTTGVSIPATKKLYLDGGTHTYITESANDVLDIHVGTDSYPMLRLYESGTDYVHVFDNVRLGVGNNPDLTIYHTSDQSYISNSTGRINVQNQALDQDIRFSVNDGGVTSNILTLNAASSRVGIGTTSPVSKLDLGGSTSGQRLTFSNTGVNTTNGARTQAEIGYKTGSYGGAAVIKILTETQYDDSMALAFYTGTSAAETMRIDSNQNVGIGTASPAHEMVLRKDQAAATEFSIVNLTSNASASTNLRFRNATSGSESGNGGLIQLANGNTFKIINQFGNPLVFGTSNEEKMRIDSSGRLLIGDTSVHYSGTDLQVGNTSDSQNGIQIQTSTTGNGYVLFGDGTGASAYRGQIRYDHTNDSLNLTAGGSEEVYVKGGNVGIGTASPGTKLEVNGGIKISSDNQKLTIGANSDLELYAHDPAGDSRINVNNNPLLITYNGVDRFRMNSTALIINEGGGDYNFKVEGDNDASLFFVDAGTDRVGIGTNSPSAKLDVKSQINVTNSNNNSMVGLKGTNFGYSTSYRALQIGATSGTYSIALGYDPSTNASPQFTGDGREVLFRNGVEFMTPNSANTGFHNDVLVLKDGSVGIGTASPAEKLHVVGDVRIDTDLYIQPTNKFYLDGGLDTYIKESSANVMEFYCADSRRMQLTTTYLQVPDGAYLAAGNDNDIFIRHDGNGHLQSNTGTMFINQVSNNSMIFSTSNTERIRVEGGGDVGINCTNPPFQLKVNVTQGTYTSWETIAGFQAKRSADSETEAGIMINSLGDALGGQISSNWYWSNNTGQRGNTGRSAGIFGISNSTTTNSEFYWQTTPHNSNTVTTRMELDGATSTLHVDGDVVAYSTTVSDKRLKDNVETIDNALGKVMKLRGVEFDWNATSRKGQHDIGLIAQEVEEVIPEIVREKEFKVGEFTDNKQTFKTVDYDKMVGVLIEAIKEQQQQINELKEKLNG